MWTEDEDSHKGHPASCAHLGLVANDVDAARVNKRDDAIGVVPRQELRGHRQAVHIHGHWRTGHLMHMNEQQV